VYRLVTQGHLGKSVQRKPIHSSLLHEVIHLYDNDYFKKRKMPSIFSSHKCREYAHIMAQSICIVSLVVKEYVPSS